MKHDGTETASAPAQITAGLVKLSLALRHQAWQVSGQSGLTPTQAQILVLVESLGATGVSVSTVAQQLSVTKGTASGAVSALERKGLVRKKADSSDGRAVVLELTRKGRREAERSAQWPDVVLGAIGTLPRAEQVAFLRALIGVIRNLQERGAIPTARMCAQCRFFRPNQYPGRDKPHHCAYLEAPIADVDLRIDCDEMEPAEIDLQPQLLEALYAGTSIDAFSKNPPNPTKGARS